MNEKEIREALRIIDTPQALPAVVEYELEDLGLIVTDDGPYAKLTEAGRKCLEVD